MMMQSSGPVQEVRVKTDMITKVGARQEARARDSLVGHLFEPHQTDEAHMARCGVQEGLEELEA